MPNSVPGSLHLTLIAAAWVQDTAAAIRAAPFPARDTVVVESPLPGGLSAVVRVLFNLPPWFQAAGFVVGVVVAAGLLAYAWKRRRILRQWIATRERRVQWALAAALVVVIAVGGGAGAYGWNYMEHDNGFCTGCHVMNPAFQRFVAVESGHDTLSCHACHQQGMLANLRQLYLWVAERPEEIGAHAPVPDRVCKSCHGVGDPQDEVWTRIAQTAGHRVHLESDSAALREVMCVTCHGREVHRFVPATQTCAQQGCHEESAVDIVLGRMAGQTFQHCTQCHRFTADVPALALSDSARQTLVPARGQCLSCHEMQAVAADYDVARDPHSGQCGLCHNPHTQVRPEASVTTCASAACHADWREHPFHLGRPHRASGTQCLTCHTPHAARVDAADCEGCHASVRARGGVRVPQPFDTIRALRRISIHADPPPHLFFAPPRGPSDDESTPHDWGNAPPEDEPPSGVRLVPVTQAVRDSFRHDRHRSLHCLTCHRSTTRHGELTFTPPRGCQICHHQAPLTSRCETCHRLDQLRADTLAVHFTITVDGTPRERTVPFSHERHRDLACVACHTTPVSLALSAERAQCRGCHDVHHEPVRTCATCHRTPALRAAHERELEGRENASHQRCDACHTPTTVALLEPRRSFCLTCHTDLSASHYPDRECTRCHLLAEPWDWRSRLFRRRPP
jgi:hypothetical protein